MSQRNTVLWLTGFSLVSLGGVLAGLLVTSMASVTMESVVMAITAGTFIYVGATEVIIFCLYFAQLPCEK